MGKKTKVTLDTNILVSALGWEKGNPHRILQKVIDGNLELFISHDQFEELSRVLDYPKLKFTEEQKVSFKALVSMIATFVEPATKLEVIKEDPSDNRILECAQAADVDFIVSGDEHPLSLGKFGMIRIVRAYRLLEMEN